jgi:hypothetical protein
MSLAELTSSYLQLLFSPMGMPVVDVMARLLRPQISRQQWLRHKRGINPNEPESSTPSKFQLVHEI